MTDPVEEALSIGEVAWALRCARAASKAASKAGAKVEIVALRREAAIHLANADDEDLPDLALAAKAARRVIEHERATADDFEALAWSELLISKPRKAKAALDEALAREPARARPVAAAAVAWATKRTDTKRLDALVKVASSASTSRTAEVELAVRLLLQAHVCPLELADTLGAAREAAHAIWDPLVARSVALRVAAYRVHEKPDRAAKILAAWARGCKAALPDSDDARRHVLDMSGVSEESLSRRQRRVERVAARFGKESAALELPLLALASQARHANAHAVAVDALRKLDKIRAKGRSQGALLDRHLSLGDLRDSLIALGKYDEAFAVIAIEDSVAAQRHGHLVPNHHARARVYEARGDWDRVVEEHLAAVAQYEQGPPPIYGPGATNTDLARGWARMAMERAGRGKEGNRLFPPEKRGS